MRVVLWVTVIAAALWSGYWLVGSRAVERGVQGWFAGQAALGITAANTGIQVRGFPNRFDLTLTEPAIANPATGFGWSAPFAQVFAMTWKPWHLIAALPEGQVITLPGQTLTLGGQGMRASLLLHPSGDLGLREAVAEGSAMRLGSTLGWQLALARLVLSLAEDETRANGYRIGLAAKGVRPGGAAAPAGLPDAIEAVHLDGTLQLSAPLVFTQAEVAPLVEAITIREVGLLWGSLRIGAEGQLQAGAEGLAEGEIRLRIEGWRDLPAALVALGVMPAELRLTFERAVERLAAEGADRQVLVLPLALAEGRMRLGPIPLGPAPALNPATDQRQ